MDKNLTRIFEALDKQRKEKSSSDIIDLIFDDGSKIPVHRSLLMGASNVFHEIFTNGMKENNLKEISIFPPHINGFKAMIEQVCYGRDNSKLDYDIIIWSIICKHKYHVKYDLHELNIDVPEDGLSLLLYLAEILEYNNTIKQVAAYNYIRHNANIPPKLSSTEAAQIVLYHEFEDSFRIYKIIDNKIYWSHNVHVFYDDFRNIERAGNSKISHQCYDGEKSWIVILNKFNNIGDYICFNPEAMGEKISPRFGRFICALHPTKSHIVMIGLEHIYVFDYQERKLVDKYKIDLNPHDPSDDNNTEIKGVILSCNGKYTLYITYENKYIFEGPKMIKKLDSRTCKAKFHPTKDNIIVLLNSTDNNEDVLVVYNIEKDSTYELTGLQKGDDYYFSAKGEYIYIESKASGRFISLSLESNLTENKSYKIDGLDMNSETFLVPDPKNEQGIYYYANCEIYWINVSEKICLLLEDVHKEIPVRISGMLILKETHN